MFGLYKSPMQLVLADDSIPFDGHSPNLMPMGGAEKAFAEMATALARRGHQVTALNRIAAPSQHEGVNWMPLDGARPSTADVLIAFRKPTLLDAIPEAGKRVLWFTAEGKQLNRPANQEILEKHEPLIVFLGRHHRDTWNPWREFKVAIVPPGVGSAFLGEGMARGEDRPAPPRAIVTTHPLHGLDGILDIWRATIRRRVPGASLDIYSAALFRGLAGHEIAPELSELLTKVKSLAPEGVAVHKPMADPGMAAAYRAARVHLYPEVTGETYGFTLAESQACGLPAVARDRGAARERVRNGQTGFVVPDLGAIANVASHLLENDGAHAGMARDARLLQAGRSWDVAAGEFEAFLR